MIKKLCQVWAETIAFLMVWRELCKSQSGKFGLGSIISVMIGAVVIGSVVVALWSTFAGTDTSIQALTETDAGTVALKALWPVVIIVIGIGIAAGVVVWALRKFNLMN